MTNVRVEGNILQHNKNCVWQTHSQCHGKWKKGEAISLKSGTKQGCQQ